EPRPPFEDKIIRYYGQYVAVVIAETFEIAQAAARSIRVSYDEEKPNLSRKMEQEDLKKEESKRGDVAKGFASAPVKIDQTYITTPEVHNPIEMHATVAIWDEKDGKYTLYETSQALATHQNVMAQVMGLPKENVRVISRYLGSGFGGKLWPWPHSALAAAAARKLKRPVKIVLDRSMMFTNVGYRPQTEQKIKIGAGPDGKLISLEHSYVAQTDMLGEYKENCGEVSGFLYGVPNVLVNSGVARRNMGAPTSMRGPGAVPGLFALESAMDELAVALKMDPVQLRLLNDTQIDGSSGRPFSSRHLKECLELGAQKFGWDKRTAGIGSMRNGNEIIGYGVSACTWGARRLDATVSVEFKRDGKIRVKSGTHDIGTGMYTVLAQIVHEQLGIPMDKIEVHL
ncbi:MAG: xanthine dehydrogenase family protein molybdopterin-binding subunit, partial [Cytophagaceae bacterium]